VDGVDLWCKLAPLVDGEAARLEWMFEQGLPVPRVIAHGPTFIMMSVMPGVDAARAEAPPAMIVRALAEGLRLLHALPTDDCPFDRTLAVTMAEARERAAGHVLAELERTRPTSEDIVFTHGDYCLPNVMMDPLGFVDCGRAGKADRYQDLALAARSVAYNLGTPWVGALWQAYGLERPDEAKLAFYTLLDEFF
jgi:aminoglycoside 3'-phosphotransferase II